MTKSMFHASKLMTERNSCDCCKWDHTNMCPVSSDFIGRTTFDRHAIVKNKLCHRFVITDGEAMCREEIIFAKLRSDIN